MKAKYRHEGNDCLIYDQVICEDNIVVTVRSCHSSWYDGEPRPTTTVCRTNAEARRMFYLICNKFEKQHFECLYKEETK